MSDESSKKLKFLSLGNIKSAIQLVLKLTEFADGGGVRGLSSLIILKRVMDILGAKMKRQDLQPYQYFDLIGGTSTGG